MLLLFISECSAYVFLQEFYCIQPYIQDFNSFQVYFCVWCQSVLISLLTCNCLVFPAPLTEETVFPPLYVLASFVIDQLAICSWVYFLAFQPIPLICTFVFMPIPWCFDYCSFVVQFEVGKHDSSTSVFLFQYCFGYLGSSVLLHKF